MAIDQLLALLEREAEAEVARIGAAAAAEVESIEREVGARVERERAAALERIAVAQAGALQRAVAALERDQRERILVARAGAIDRVFDAARDRLRVLPAAEIEPRIGRLVADTVRYLEGQPAVLECRPDLASGVAAAAPDPGNLRINPAPDVAPGIVGRAEDGSVIVDNSLPARLARRRPDLAIALLRRLEEATDAVG